MSTRSRLLPHPAVSLVLLVLWLWLNSTVAFGHLVLGAVLALAIPHLVDRMLPPVERDLRMRELAAFGVMVLGDIVIANLSVTRLILRRPERLQPVFVVVPLELERSWAVTLLASTISLTPGTVSAELSADRRLLLVHALSDDGTVDLVAHIKSRYERPILEFTR